MLWKYFSQNISRNQCKDTIKSVELEKALFFLVMFTIYLIKCCVLINVGKWTFCLGGRVNFKRKTWRYRRFNPKCFALNLNCSCTCSHSTACFVFPQLPHLRSPSTYPTALISPYFNFTIPVSVKSNFVFRLRKWFRAQKEN